MVQSSGFRAQSSGFRFQGSRNDLAAPKNSHRCNELPCPTSANAGAQDLGSVDGLGLRVEGLGFRVLGSVFSVQCSVFSVQCSVFEVEG